MSAWTAENFDIGIIEPEFALMKDSPYNRARLWHVYCSGGWARLSCGGMNMDAAEKSFSSRPKTSLFSHMPIPSDPAVLELGFGATNFSGFRIERGDNATFVYLCASSVTPAWPYFIDPSEHFLAQLKMYNDLHGE